MSDGRSELTGSCTQMHKLDKNMGKPKHTERLNELMINRETKNIPTEHSRQKSFKLATHTHPQTLASLRSGAKGYQRKTETSHSDYMKPETENRKKACRV